MRWRTRCWAPGRAVAVLSGPTFAREVGAGLPTAMTIASPDADLRRDARARSVLDDFSRLHLHRHHRRRGRRRGQERARDRRRPVRRPGLRRQHAHRADHARPGRDDAPRAWRSARSRETFMGLAGLGDLVLTCTDDQSRNRRFGLALAQGAAVEARAWRRSARWSRATTPPRHCARGRARARGDADRRGHLRRAVRAAAGRTGGARPDDAADQAGVRLARWVRPTVVAKPLWRQASYTTTATALARLRLRLPGRIGIRMRRSRGCACSSSRRQPARLRTEQQRVAGPVARLAVAAARRRSRPQTAARLRQPRQAGGEVAVTAQDRQARA